MNNIPWSQNDALFIKELKEGHEWQSWPALFFRLHGLSVEVPNLSIRENISEADKWKDSFDLIVENFPMENKSRNEEFTCAKDFPYSTIFVDTVSGYNNKKIKPHVYIMISKPTGCLLWLPSLNADKWSIESKFDHTRKIYDDFYMCETKRLKPISTLVNFLKSRKKNK